MSSNRPQETSFNGQNPESIARDVLEQASPSAEAPVKPSRMIAPDLLRGLLMLFQSIDHCAMGITAWQHGVARLSEMDGQNVTEWNEPLPCILRNLTHLCAPGFMFLLGMGVVYFGHSRRKLGWSQWRLFRHFATRAIVLFLVNEVAFLWMASGLWIFNIVLIALAINYLISGLIWMGVTVSENWMKKMMIRRGSGERQPLLKSTDETHVPWHIHNLLLVILTAITIGWNSWLSPDHGTCVSPTSPPAVAHGSIWFDFWFYMVSTPRVLSGFPPLAWLSFAILGLLYGRIVTSRNWSRSHLIVGNFSAGILLLILFITTRLFRYGNLAEDCLHMSEHVAHPGRNQYLSSIRSFLYVTKYPPSFSFFTLTMSVNLILLAIFTALPPKFATRLPTLLVFGTSALFFYVTHLLYYSILGHVIKERFGKEQPWWDEWSGQQAIGISSRWAFWGFWGSGIAILYPLCRWYGGVKSRSGTDSILRFF